MNTPRLLFFALERVCKHALVLLALVFLAFSTPVAHANPGIVRVTATGATSGPCGDRIDWENACSLQHALKDIAVSGDELWVAAGTYKPTTGTDRTATFKLKVSIALYGGFAGGEMLRTQRSFTANVTILSGDIGVPGDVSDNSYNVVGGDGASNTTVLDGFTVTGGNSDGNSGGIGRGGGMYNYGSDLTLSNVIFTGNRASSGGGMANDYSNPILTNVTFISNTATSGGGMANDHHSWPTLTNVTFSGNAAASGGGMSNTFTSPTLTNVTFISNTASYQGGGMSNTSWSNPLLTNVTFRNNSATYGGGIYNEGGSNPSLTNVTFSGNSASNDGGGLYNKEGSPTIVDVTFSNNTAGGSGGGVYDDTSNPTLTNVTFSGNSASDGGGIYNTTSSWPTLTNVTFSGNAASSKGGGMSNYGSSNPTVRNAVFWGNTPSNPQIYNSSSTPSLYDSVVQGGYAGGTDIVTADPHLGALGYWGGSTQTIPLLMGSSAIDAGDDTHCPPTDQRGFPRPVGAHCDIGAFEGVLNLVHLPLIAR